MERGRTNRNLSQFFEESMSERMFDTRFCDSVAALSKCSSINDSMPFRYVSRMYDSKMSDKSMDDESVMKEEIEFKPKPKRLEDFELGDLVEKFLAKDAKEDGFPKSRIEIVANKKAKAVAYIPSKKGHV